MYIINHCYYHLHYSSYNQLLSFFPLLNLIIKKKAKNVAYVAKKPQRAKPSVPMLASFATALLLLIKELTLETPSINAK